MNGITIKLQPFQTEYELAPIYIKEVDMIELSIPERRASPYGVDIDGRLIFDIDAQHMLINVELVIERRLWEAVQTTFSFTVSTYASLEFTSDTLAMKSFSLPLRVQTDPNRAAVLIQFTDQPLGRVVGLSPRSAAFIQGDVLQGFYVNLM